jgi:hypothetical protein
MLVAKRQCDNFRTCSNEGRYIATDGYTLCSLCAMERPGVVAVRIVDLPRFIHLAQTLARKSDCFEAKELLKYLPYDYDR